MQCPRGRDAVRVFFSHGVYARCLRIFVPCSNSPSSRLVEGEQELGASQVTSWCGLSSLAFLISFALYLYLSFPALQTSSSTSQTSTTTSWIHPQRYQTSSRSLTISLQNVFSLSKKYALSSFLFFCSPCSLQIGFGNWGSVWLCHPKSSSGKVKDMKVAVKLVHRSKTSTTAARVRSL